MSRLAQYMKAGESVLLGGPPGCAKTARILAAAKSIDYDVYLSRASLSDRIDYAGCLVPDFDKGITRALPLEAIKLLRETTRPTVWFIDDLGQAPIDAQAALMQLFDNNFLPANVLVWAATNRPGDKAGVTALCEPLRSRFSLCFGIATPDSRETPNGTVYLGSWKDEVEGWIEWAMLNNLPSDVWAYHRFNSGEHLYKWQPNGDPTLRMADFRSWHTVARLYAKGIRDAQSIAGAIGMPDASAFLAFVACAKDLPSPDEVFANPATCRVPTEPSPLYLLASCLSAAVTPKTMAAMLTYGARLQRLYEAYMVRDAHKRLKRALYTHPAWNAWYAKNRELFIDQ